MRLAKLPAPPYMIAMGTFRPAGKAVCTAFAVLFAFMSLAHGLVMQFAGGSGGKAHHSMVHGAAAMPGQHGMPSGHAHDGHRAAMPASAEEPAAAKTAPDVCFSFGCFLVVAPDAPRAGAAILSLLGKLSPSPGATFVAAALAPAKPPPRLQA